MKISVIITTLLVAQVSASFFDVFQGAVLSVQNSFGKLLSDVVTDVKETVDCTILAVEHVLSLSHDATTRYYHKCGSETNKTDSVSDARQDANLPKVEVTLNLPNNEEYLQKVIPAEIDARINETLSKALGNLKSHDNVLSIENVLAKESEQLAGVSDLVKKELEKLSNEVSKDIKKMEEQRDSEASVDTILQELKVLEKREQNSKNTSEANEIHQVIDQVLGKLDAIEATEATENFKLEEILKDLESNSNNNLVGLRHQLEEWKEEESRHLSEIKSKIEKHEKLTDHLGQYKKYESNHSQPVIFNTGINEDDVDTHENSQDISSYYTTQLKETLDKNTSTRTIGDSNDKSLLLANSSSFSQNSSFYELNDTVITSTSYSSTESPLESVKIHLFENPNADKQQSLVSNETNFLWIHEDNSNETVIISTATLAVTDTSPNDSGKEELQKLGAINNAVVASTAHNTTSTTLESFKNENSKDSANISTIATMMVENASVNESVTTLDHIESTETMTASLPTSLYVIDVTEKVLSIDSSTTTVNEEFSTVTAKIISEIDDKTMLPSCSTILESTSIIENVLPEQTAVASGKENSLIFATNIADDNDSNDTIASNSLILESAPLSKAIQVEETDITANEELTESTVTSTTRNGGDSDTTLISTPIPTISTSESETIQGTLSTSRTTSSANKDFSTITTKIIYGNYSNNARRTANPPSILDTTPVSKTFETEELTTASDKEKSSIVSNVTLKLTTYSTVESTPVSETIEPEENSTSASNDDITESTSTSVTDKDSKTTITSTPTTIIWTSTSESETKYFSSTANKLTEIPDAEDDDKVVENDDDSSATVGMSIPDAITESISEANILAYEDEEPLLLITFPPETSPVTLMDIDSKSDYIITSTPFPISEMTTVNKVTDLVQTTTFTEDEEPLIFSTSPATVRDEVAVKNETENTDSAVVTEIIQNVETTTVSEEQALSSSSTQSATYKIVTSTAYPPTESIPTTDVMAYRNEWLTPNKLNQQNYNTNGEQRNNYEFNGPKSLSDRLLLTRQPLINPEVPIYSQAAMPPITRGLLNDAPKSLPPNMLIPDFPGQPPKVDSDALRKAAFSHSDSPLGPEKDIFKNIPLIPNTPREPISSPRMYYENPSYVPLPQHSIRPPFNSATENTYRQLSLTTHRPVRTAAHANNFINPSFDYDSFFHLRDPEAHQRALKEARQLMANAKRSDRIINNIMKNKNKFKARSIFG